MRELFAHVKKQDPEIYGAIYKEIARQHDNLELIASENYASLAVMEAQGCVMTNKYAEGYPSARWYGGCDHVDTAETLAIERAQQIFGADHVNVQPHSGAQANTAVYIAVLSPGDTLMAMDLACGGHLTHGHRLNFSGKFYRIASYGVDKTTEQLDYNVIEDLAKQSKPKLIVAGASAYPRKIDFKAFSEIAKKVGARLMVDMAHIAGLVACGLHQSPVPYADFVTTTTHKTLRGPRGGMILCRKEFAKKIDVSVFPGTQGGPLMHVIAAKAVALKEAQGKGFKSYQEQVVRNADVLQEELARRGFRIVSGGTDNHLMLVDLTPKHVTGKDAVEFLDRARITVNKNLIPYDPQPPLVSSGIRLGTPALTTRNMKDAQMREVASLIDKVISSRGDEKAVKETREAVRVLADAFPIYAELTR
jgi:glycine hydroxymethyltransferase